MSRAHSLWAIAFVWACGPEPQLETFGFSSPTPVVTAGDNLGVVATGLDASNEIVIVEAFVTPELSGRPHRIGERPLELQGGPSPQQGSLQWPLDDEVFRFEGKSLLHFEATLGDRTLRTTQLPFEVVPRLDALSIEFDSPFSGTTTIVPADATLDLEIVGEHLAGRRQILLEVYNEGDGRRIERKEIEPTADRTEVRFSIPPGILGAQTSGVLRFEASMEGEPKKEATITVQTEGIFGCGFYDASGRLLGPTARIARGTALELRVYAFGLEGRSAAFDLVEQDGVEDDFVARFVTAVLDGVAKDAWTTDFVDDGLFDGVDEYKFHADLGLGHSCDSPLLEVPQ